MTVDPFSGEFDRVGSVELERRRLTLGMRGDRVDGRVGEPRDELADPLAELLDLGLDASSEAGGTTKVPRFRDAVLDD
jgi:hypothetical protein